MVTYDPGSLVLSDRFISLKAYKLPKHCKGDTDVFIVLLLQSQNVWRSKHIRFCFDTKPFTDKKWAHRLSFNFSDKKWIYPRTCLSTWLQQWSAGDLYCRVDWSWRGNILYFMNVTYRVEGESRARTGVSSECWPEIILTGYLTCS